MVELVENKSAVVKTIESYGSGGFRINGGIFLGNVIVYHNYSTNWNTSNEILSFLEQFKDLDLIIFGTGFKVSTTDKHFLELMDGLSMGIECLDTPAACRLYNMLALEGRNLAGVFKNI